MYSRGLEAIFCYVTDFRDCEERQMSTNYNQMPPPVPADRPANFGKNNLGRFLLFFLCVEAMNPSHAKENLFVHDSLSVLAACNPS